MAGGGVCAWRARDPAMPPLEVDGCILSLSRPSSTARRRRKHAVAQAPSHPVARHVSRLPRTTKTAVAAAAPSTHHHHHQHHPHYPHHHHHHHHQQYDQQAHHDEAVPRTAHERSDPSLTGVFFLQAQAAAHDPRPLPPPRVLALWTDWPTDGLTGLADNKTCPTPSCTVHHPPPTTDAAPPSVSPFCHRLPPPSTPARSRQHQHLSSTTGHDDNA